MPIYQVICRYAYLSADIADMPIWENDICYLQIFISALYLQNVSADIYIGCSLRHGNIASKHARNTLHPLMGGRVLEGDCFVCIKWLRTEVQMQSVNQSVQSVQTLQYVHLSNLSINHCFWRNHVSKCRSRMPWGKAAMGKTGGVKDTMRSCDSFGNFALWEYYAKCM